MRLKVKVKAHVQSGRANVAITALLADKVMLKKKDIEIVKGPINAFKQTNIQNISKEQLDAF